MCQTFIVNLLPRHQPFVLYRHLPGHPLIEVEICRAAVMFRHTKTSDMGASRAGQCRVDFSPVSLARTHDDRTLHAGAGSGGGRSSAIIRRMSAKRFCRGRCRAREPSRSGPRGRAASRRSWLRGDRMAIVLTTNAEDDVVPTLARPYFAAETGITRSDPAHNSRSSRVGFSNRQARHRAKARHLNDSSAKRLGSFV
jgi:hypothetical protein